MSNSVPTSQIENSDAFPIERIKRLAHLDAASTDWPTLKQNSEVAADWRFAAVLVPILDRNNPSVLLTKRSSNLAHHSGHISFPGGRPHEDDRSVGSTALREASEEISLRSEDVQLLGCLSPHRTRKSQNIVVPVIGIVSASANWTPQAEEVDEIIELPFSIVMDQQLPKRYTEGDRNGAWYWSNQPWDIWGVTAAILISLAEAVRNVK